VLAIVFGDVAEAAPARIRFRIEPKAYSEALLDIAQQADVTLIGAAACVGQSRERLAATLTLEQALDQLLAGAPCAARVVAPGAVVVSPLPRAVAPSDAPPSVVSELLVTATRRVRDPRQLAVAITAIPREHLLATGVVDASEAAGQIAGVVATNLGPGRDKLLLRGLSDGAYTGRARSVVATYLDDIPVNYNAPDPDLRLVDVDRVEMARGPQGALYGSGSLSGVYRIVTRKPDLTWYSAEARVSGSLTKDGALGNATEGYLNAPLWGGRLGVRLAAYREVQGGYLDDPLQNRKDVNRTERWGGRLGVLVQTSDNWSVNITAAGQHLKSDDTQYTSPGFGLTRAVRIPEPHVNDIESLTATVKHSWGWADLTSSTGFVRHAYGSFYDATSTQTLYTSYAQTSAYSERSRTKMLVQDVVLTSRGSGPLDWLVGFYGAYTSLDSPTAFLAQVPRAPNIPVYSDTRTDNITETAAYGEVSYAFEPRWTVAAGGRAFNIRIRTKSDVISERFAPRSLDRGTSLAGFSPKISIQRELDGGGLAYGVVSEGYRAGGINSGGAQPLPAQRETFAPDRLVNFETGLKLQALSKRLQLNTAVFYDLWTDIQTDQFRPSGIPYTTNAGDARILGLESELSFRFTNGLSTQINGQLTRTRTTRTNPDFATQLANSLPGAPAISAGALVSYERDIPGDWKLRLIGQFTYVGHSRVTFDALEPTTRGYARTRLSAEVYRRALSLQVFVSNPTNAYSDTFAFGNPFNPPPKTLQITPQRPVTLGITLSAAL
jgi:outer membrane receptor protein involved in Fe transport